MKPFTHYYNEILIFLKDGEERPQPFTHFYNEILIFFKDGEAMPKPFTHICNEILIFLNKGRRGHDLLSIFLKSDPQDPS